MGNYEVDVLVNGRPIRQFNHKGDVFVEGRKGSEFELKFTNNTWGRVEIVASVDGLSVMDGEECGTNSSGYLVPARQSIVIPGWRLDNSNVAKFVFKGKNKSYSAKSGHGTSNVGAVGFMVFEEKVSYFYPQPFQPYGICSTNDVHFGSLGQNVIRGATSSNVANNISPKASNSVEIEKNSDAWELGVGFGDEDSHYVQEVEFTRLNQHNPESIITVYYDSRKGLENRGIQVVKSRKKKVSELPNPFPTYSGTGCTPPPGWKRKK